MTLNIKYTLYIIFVGIPMDVSHEGNFFCFAFIRNKANTEPGSGAEAPRNLGIFITTQNSNPVDYQIRSDNTGYTRTGTVTAGTIVREEYMTPNVQEVNMDTTSAGIIVETVNSSQTIQVMGFSDSFGSSDGFLAVPIIQYRSNFTYGYASLSASAVVYNSMIAVVACGDIAVYDIKYSTEGEASFFVSSPYINGGFAHVDYGDFFSAKMSQYNTLGLQSLSYEFTGFRAKSNQPIGFMTGHECAQILLGDQTCDHIIEQIPPSYTWGYNFFVAPFEDRRGYVFKVWPRYEGTSFTVYCSNGTSFNISSFQFNEINVDNRQRFELNSQSYCCIQSDRPLLVMQYGFSHEHDNYNTQFGDPNMVLVAPISQYLNQHIFTTIVSMYTRENDDFTNHYISVTVLTRYFVPNAILLDGTPLEPNVTKWSIINCSQNDPCGYGISKRVNIGTHTVQHTNPNASINVIVYGWRIEKGYAYPAGYGMNPVGGE